MKVTIDTNILKKALAENSLDHVRVMMKVIDNKLSITSDYNHQLFDEYNDELSQYPLYQKWFKEVVSNAFYCPHRIIRRHKDKLISLGFHEPEDHLVLGIACNSDKYVVTEDSDFGKGDTSKAKDHEEVFIYITDAMEVIIHDAKEALNTL